MNKTPTELYNEFLPYVMQNWYEIQSNEQIYKTMDVNTNVLCQKLKYNYPLIHDVINQVVVFTHLFTMLVYVSLPVNGFDIINFSNKNTITNINDYDVLTVVNDDITNDYVNKYS